MKELCIVGVLSLCVVSVSIGGADGSNRQAGVEMSVSVDNTTSNSSAVTGSSSASGAHSNVGVWRPRGNILGDRRPPGSDIGPSQPRYVARGSRRRPAYIQRFRQRMRNNRRRNRRPNVRTNPHGGNQGLGLVATGSHSIASARRPEEVAGVDPAVALQTGHRRRLPFQDRQTAYDFLSNGGNSFRARSRRQRERGEENARMASVMCGVFGKQFIPSAIGGRCVDPPN